MCKLSALIWLFFKQRRWEAVSPEALRSPEAGSRSASQSQDCSRGALCRRLPRPRPRSPPCVYREPTADTHPPMLRTHVHYRQLQAMAGPALHPGPGPGPAPHRLPGAHPSRECRGRGSSGSPPPWPGRLRLPFSSVADLAVTCREQPDLSSSTPLAFIGSPGFIAFLEAVRGGHCWRIIQVDMAF